MSNPALKALHKLMPYWTRREIACQDQIYFLYEDMGGDSGRPFSARLASDVALGYLVYGRVTEDAPTLNKSVQILRYVLANQHSSGAFEWNLPDPIAGPGTPVKDQVDLGTVLDVYYYFVRSGVVDGPLLQEIQQSVRRAIAYLREHAATSYSGVIKKRDYGPAKTPAVDVLNGDAMVVAAYTRASQLLGEPGLLMEAEPYVNNLLQRFGAHYPGWWPYSERLPDRADTAVRPPGISVFFQAMMLLYLEPYFRLTHNPQLRSTLREGLRSVIAATSRDGTIDYTYESRQGIEQRPNIMLPASMLALQDLMDNEPFITSRLEYVADRLVAADGTVSDEHGGPTGELWRIWLMSDLAICLLYTPSLRRSIER
ncbi:hypothetical protein [Paenibacillus koleovorans]|uniref:hypothetical protein n=1 Tax=Paenibacillus koleovorans TaxID=121608 RepID=UPI000FD80A7A|nr:hypothetical protein [Paenibacillus koleovorans]